MLLRYLATVTSLLLLLGPVDALADQRLWYYVIDKSGSIEDYQLEEPITDMVLDHLSRLTVDDEVRIIFFNESMTHVWTRNSATPRAKNEFEEYFRTSFEPIGNTCLYDAAAKVIAEVNSIEKDYDAVQIMILSDGEDTGGGAHQSWNAVDIMAGQLQVELDNCYIYWYTLGFEPDETPDNIVVVPLGDIIGVMPPIARFEVFPSNVLVGQEVFFDLKASAGGPIERCRWSFGDGDLSEHSGLDLDTRHTYVASGAYDVSLYVAGPAADDSITVTSAVTVREVQLIADFDHVPQSPQLGVEVAIISKSQGDIDSHHWRIEGQDYYDEDIRHTFQSRGDFSIQLEVSGGGAPNSVTKIIHVRPPLSDPAFTCDPLVIYTIGSPPIIMTATVQEEGVSHEWLLPGGTVLHGAVARTTPTEPGPYVITHVVRSEGGINQGYHTVVVIEPDAPNPTFSISPGTVVTLGTSEDRFVCQAEDVRPGMVHTWKVIGADVTGKGDRFEWIPNTPGDNYTIVHEIKRGLDGQTKPTSKIVRVDHNPVILVKFEVSDQSVRTGHEVVFEDKSESEVPIVSYVWDFGDGNTSEFKDPTHVYEAAGEYNVTLKAGNGGQFFSNTEERVVVVKPLPPKWLLPVILAGVLILIGLLLWLFLRPPALNGTITWKQTVSDVSGEFYPNGRGKFNLIRGVNADWPTDAEEWAPAEGLHLAREKSRAYYWYCGGVQDRLATLPKDHYEHEGIEFTYTNDIDEHVDPDAFEEDEFA
jgi:PKD repeat protein